MVTTEDNIMQECHSNLNALGFNEVDGFVYGRDDGTSQLIRISSNGLVENLGLITKPTYAGDIVDDTLYFSRNHEFWTVDNLSTRTASTVSIPITVTIFGYAWISNTMAMFICSFQIDLPTDDPTNITERRKVRYGQTTMFQATRETFTLSKILRQQRPLFCFNDSYATK